MVTPNTEAVILAGGLGTRLRSVLPKTPKPLAPIGGRPFVRILIDRLVEAGINRIVLSVGYLAEQFEGSLGNVDDKAQLLFCREDAPLGTGGAIKKAAKLVQGERFFALNGDTYSDVSLIALDKFHSQNDADISVAAFRLKNHGRYGSLDVADGRITQFREKAEGECCLINAGVYVINQTLVREIPDGVSSFERDSLPLWANGKKILAFEFKGYFLDIGVPEDLARAGKLLPQWLKK